MQVQRINVNVVKGNEVDEEVELEQLFNKADKAIAPMQVLEDEPKDRAENLIEMGNLFTDRLLKKDCLRDRMNHRSLMTAAGHMPK